MDTWLGPGEVFEGRSRNALLQRLAMSVASATLRNGKLLTRHALIQHAEGDLLSIRAAGRGLVRALAQGGRLTITASTHIGGNRLSVIDGTVTLRDALEAADGRDVVLLDMAVDRVESWAEEAVARHAGAGSLRLAAHAG